MSVSRSAPAPAPALPFHLPFFVFVFRFFGVGFYVCAFPRSLLPSFPSLFLSFPFLSFTFFFHILFTFHFLTFSLSLRASLQYVSHIQAYIRTYNIPRPSPPLASSSSCAAAASASASSDFFILPCNYLCAALQRSPPGPEPEPEPGAARFRSTPRRLPATLKAQRPIALLLPYCRAASYESAKSLIG